MNKARKIKMGQLFVVGYNVGYSGSSLPEDIEYELLQEDLDFLVAFFEGKRAGSNSIANVYKPALHAVYVKKGLFEYIVGNNGKEVIHKTHAYI